MKMVSAREYFLSDWTVQVHNKGRVTVEGVTKDLSEGKAWRSSVITERIDHSTVKSYRGSVYHLRGPLNRSLARQNGVPEYTIVTLSRGFPENWKDCISSAYQKSSIKGCPLLSTSQGSVCPSYFNAVPQLLPVRPHATLVNSKCTNDVSQVFHRPAQLLTPKTEKVKAVGRVKACSTTTKNGTRPLCPGRDSAHSFSEPRSERTTRLSTISEQSTQTNNSFLESQVEKLQKVRPGVIVKNGEKNVVSFINSFSKIRSPFRTVHSDGPVSRQEGDAAKETDRSSNFSSLSRMVTHGQHKSTVTGHLGIELLPQSSGLTTFSQRNSSFIASDRAMTKDQHKNADADLLKRKPFVAPAELQKTSVKRKRDDSATEIPPLKVLVVSLHRLECTDKTNFSLNVPPKKSSEENQKEKPSDLKSENELPNQVKKQRQLQRDCIGKENLAVLQPMNSAQNQSEKIISANKRNLRPRLKLPPTDSESNQANSPIPKRNDGKNCLSVIRKSGRNHCKDGKSSQAACQINLKSVENPTLTCVKKKVNLVKLPVVTPTSHSVKQAKVTRKLARPRSKTTDCQNVQTVTNLPSKQLTTTQNFVFAGKGTMKRRRQLRELISKRNENAEEKNDEFFPSTGINTAAALQDIQACPDVSISSCTTPKMSGVAPEMFVAQASIRRLCVTPVSKLFHHDQKEDDKYVYNVEKWKKEAAKREKNVKEDEAKKIQDSEPAPAECNSKELLGALGVLKSLGRNCNSDADSSIDEYFTESDHDDMEFPLPLKKTISHAYSKFLG